MSGINVQRWILGGLVAGVVLWLLEGVASVLYVEELTQALQQHGLAMDMSTGMMMLTILVSMIAGFTAVFFYAAARPRFGAGPRTAAIVGIGLWVGGYLLSLIGYHMLGLFPMGLLLLWGVAGLLEMIVATIAGAAVYRE